MNLDFPQNVPAHKVYAFARAIRMLKDKEVYTSRLINAEGERVHRVVFDETLPDIPLPLLPASIA